MSMKDLDKALSLIKQRIDEAEFVGQRSELMVRTAEKALGLKLPPTYRKFVRALGAGNFGSAEIYGVLDADFEASSAPDAVWATLRAREDNGLPKDLVILGYEDDDITCLRVGPGKEEGPVLVIHAGEDAEQLGARAVAPDFGKYLLDRVEEQLEAMQ
jgi:antitoxin YobK